jgi:hypothetical protein
VGEKYPWILSHDGNMMAIPGKQLVGAYVMELSFTNTRKHRKRAVVSLTKAHNNFNNRTKSETPPNQNRRKLPIRMNEWRSREGKP